MLGECTVFAVSSVHIGRDAQRQLYDGLRQKRSFTIQSAYLAIRRVRNQTPRDPGDLVEFSGWKIGVLDNPWVTGQPFRRGDCVESKWKRSSSANIERVGF